MPRFSLSFVAALLATAAVAATAASAATPAWAPPQILSAPGATISQMGDPTQNNRIAAAPDGSVTVAWVQNDGSNDRLVARRFSAASGSWTPAAYVSAAGEDVGAYATMMDENGNATLTWMTTAMSLRGATMLASSSSWSAPEQLEQSGESIVGGGFGLGPDGTVLMAYVVSDSGATTIKVRARARNSVNWGPVATIAGDPSLSLGGPIYLDFNGAGDGVLTSFATDTDGARHVFMLRFDHATQSWSGTPQVVASSPTDFNSMGDVAIAANGAVAVAYEDDSMTPYVRVIGADGTPAPARSLGVADTFGVLPQVAADSTNRFVVVWQTIANDFSDYAARFVSSNTDGSWSDIGSPAAGDTSAAGPVLAATTDGQLTLGFATGITTDTGHITTRATSWSAATRSWGQSTVVVDGRATASTGAPGTHGSLPRIAIDGRGHTFEIWSDNSTTPFGIGFSVLDTVAPTITSVQVPLGALTSEDVSVSATARDLWSGIASVGWDFGDGTSGTGPSARHRYTVAGDYTVRVTVTDGAGNARTTTRVIAVDDPYDDTPDLSSPSDTDLPVDPPAVDPPFVDPLPVSRPPATEARLSGRTVRLNALVKTTPSRCRGSATVVYNLPGRRYTATVTLVRTASGCRASGTIRLAKAPAKRATLRLTVRSPRIKTRTLSVRR